MTNNKPQMEHLQPSVIVIVLRLLAVLFFLDTIIALIILGFFALGNVHEWHNSYILFLLFANTVKYLFLSALIVQMFGDWVGRAYYLSGHHLIERLGLVNVTETTYELSQVKSVIVKQSWLARRFNFGTIVLSFAGGGKEKEVVLRDINNAMTYKQYFDEHLQVQGWVR